MECWLSVNGPLKELQCSLSEAACCTCSEDDFLQTFICLFLLRNVDLSRRNKINCMTHILRKMFRSDALLIKQCLSHLTVEEGITVVLKFMLSTIVTSSKVDTR